MSRKVFITCAVTGGHNQFDKHPNFPITPNQIAESALEAAVAGAALSAAVVYPWRESKKIVAGLGRLVSGKAKTDHNSTAHRAP